MSDADEIARLLEALEKIAGAKPPMGYLYWTDQRAAEGYWALFDRCRRIAAAALRIASSDREEAKP
jgi:hypothetical protein